MISMADVHSSHRRCTFIDSIKRAFWVAPSPWQGIVVVLVSTSNHSLRDSKHHEVCNGRLEASCDLTDLRQLSKAVFPLLPSSKIMRYHTALDTFRRTT